MGDYFFSEQSNSLPPRGGHPDNQIHQWNIKKPQHTDAYAPAGVEEAVNN